MTTLWLGQDAGGRYEGGRALPIWSRGSEDAGAAATALPAAEQRRQPRP